MSAIEECEVQKKYQELCLNLNMDKVTADKAWSAYINIRNNYSLSGDHTHWLCCALYVACRKSSTPTMGSSYSVVEGNGVPLTTLLRVCNISINDYFEKMKKWCEMASVPHYVRHRIDHLERSFAISKSLFQKFTPIFYDLFIYPPSEEMRVGKGKKVKLTPCTTNKVFELCWCLFICAKGNCPQQGADLVTSFDMLLCCVDLIYSNAIVDNRRDLINPNYPGVPEEWKLGVKIDNPICIMEQLSERHEGTQFDAIQTKHTWRELIKTFFDKNILSGDPNTFLNMLSMGNFETNFKSLNRIYDNYTLTCGEFDERIFLNNQENNRPGGSVIKSDVKTQSTLSNMDNNVKRLLNETPETRREFLPNNCDFLTPVSTATQSVNKLRLMLKDINESPPQSLQDIFSACNTDPKHKIQQILFKMRKKFCDKFKPNGPERFRLAESLYYRLLENIIHFELKRKPSFDVNSFLNQEILNSTLIVCSVEIVLTAYNSQTKFPWILDTLELDAYYFYKIIEIVVLCQQDLLTRDIIKHLNGIEEQCLQSLIWVSKSSIWDKISQLTIPLPSLQDVARKVEGELAGNVSQNTVFKRPDELDQNHLFMSPVHSVNRQRFPSPTTPSKAMAKMQLFKTTNQLKDESNSKEPRTNNHDPSTSSKSQTSPNKINRHGSLGLFFRKFYELAYPRMKNLCKELGLHTEDILIKIWTIFEYSIVAKTDLMKDRHLDQILMCAIYVFNRVTKLNKTFTDIMKFYRNQSQSDSHVYRSVLISYKNNVRSSLEKNSENAAPIPSGPTKPSELAGVSTSHGNEERGDIIKFYNNVYVQQMQEFAMKFANDLTVNVVQLSPLPPPRLTIQSPMKRSSNFPIYVKQLDKKETNNPPESLNSLIYTFNSSPANELNKINSVVATGGRRLLTNEMIKRNLTLFDDSESDNTTPNKIVKLENYSKHNQPFSSTTMNRKLKNIIDERQDNNK